VVLFGATGMVGQGVLRECLLDPRVERVLTVGRAATGRQHAKLGEVTVPDLADLSAVEGELAGYDACFFCLGVSSQGMTEEAYRHITYDFTLAAGQAMARQRPQSTFVYVSGAGTDSSERGRVRWARIKGRTENALLALPLRAYMFRPGYIQPLHGATSRTRSYRAFYAVTTPLYPVLWRMFGGYLTTTEQIGQAMLNAADRGAPGHILDSRDIRALAAPA
jgi:uncharacterized protein YbjT (DUF2867 family)